MLVFPGHTVFSDIPRAHYLRKSGLGEFGIGTNPEIDQLTLTGSPLLDEKVAGTIHVALGAGFPELGGQNVSGLHFDLVLDLREEGAVLVDGTPLTPLPLRIGGVCNTNCLLNVN